MFLPCCPPDAAAVVEELLLAILAVDFFLLAKLVFALGGAGGGFKEFVLEGGAALRFVLEHIKNKILYFINLETCYL